MQAIATRMLGDGSEADDVVQDAWLRLDLADLESIDNLPGWLTTVVSRLAIDRLRSRSRVELVDVEPERPGSLDMSGDLSVDVELVDSVGEALIIVLDTLRPAERLAFVLYDMFAVPFDQIGEVLGRSSAAAKQPASRARARVQGRDPGADLDPMRRRSIIDAFLDAFRNGNFEALVALLHPDVELVADPAAVAMGSPAVVTGAAGVAGMFSGRALAAEVVEIMGSQVSAGWLVALPGFCGSS